LSKNLSDRIQQLFQPKQPLWACEFTSRHIIVAGVDNRRTRVQGRTAVPIPAGLVTPSLVDVNFTDAAGVRSAIQQALKQASFRGSEIAVVIPDEASRIAFVTAETLPKTLDEQHTFLRWKLKKTVPFDIDTAQMAFQVVGTHSIPGNGKTRRYDLIVALSPRSIVEEYEGLLEGLDLHAGFVIPSTLAALTLLSMPAEDSLFVKIAPDCVTTSVLQNRHITFYRRVAEHGLYESVYPTVLYYQDKLGGIALKQLIVSTYDADAHAEIADIQKRIGVPVVPLEPRSVDDIYKPVLGAVHFS
jgi:type IV pilus assembly protein PilM